MRYLRVVMLIMIVLFVTTIFADFQDLTSEGKKNLRSANMHLGGERIEKALPLYLLVIEENPDHIEALQKIAGIYFDYKREYYLASEYYDKSMTAISKEIIEYERLIEENPKKEKKYNKKLKPFKEDMVFFEKLKSSCWTKLFVNAQNKFSIANDYFSLNPQSLDLTEVNNIVAINKMLQKVLVDTIDVNTIADNPVNIDDVSLHFSNLLDIAVSDFTKLNDFAPDSVQTIKMLSYVYNIKGDQDESLRYLIEVAKVDTEDEFVRQQIANIYFSSENYTEALIWFQAAADVNPNNTDSYFNMGITYENIGDNESAFRSFAKVVELDPENLDAVLHASTNSSKTGNKDESIKYLKMAIELDPGNIDYLSFISYTYFQAENYNDVTIYAQKWYEADKTSKEAAQLVYQAAKNIGNTELEKKFEEILLDMQ